MNEIISDSQGDVNKSESNNILEHLGKAQITIRRLKGFAKALNTKNPLSEQFIPIELLGSSGLNGPKIIKESSKGEGVKELIKKLASHSNSHLSLIPPTSSKFVNLSVYVCRRYLTELERKSFDVCEEKVEKIGSQRDGILPLKLFIKSVFK